MKSDVIVFLFLLVFIDLFHPLFHYLPSFINSVLNYEIQTCLNLHSVIIRLSKKKFSLNFTSLIAWMKVLHSVLIVDRGQQSNYINGTYHALIMNSFCDESMHCMSIANGFSSETCADRLGWLNI